MENLTLKDKLKLFLKGIFQFENRDLDFGIYKIINVLNKEISTYIDVEMIEIIGEERNLEELIINNILNFFSHYYELNEFKSNRRDFNNYRRLFSSYGEDVFLYWANYDQYFVKTNENKKYYSFKLNDLKVEFDLVTEKIELLLDKNTNSKIKFFIYHGVIPIKNNLKITFNYRRLNHLEIVNIKKIAKESKRKSIKVEDVNKYNIIKLMEQINILEYSALERKHKNILGNESEINELNWHLDNFTAKATNDIFIHKNLKEFFNKELDFYIKQKVLKLDEILIEKQFSNTINVINVFKNVSLKIIEFLVQIEEYKKFLWKKKKFVISADYCITLDYIDQKYYPIILNNEKQIENWERLFSFNIKKKLKESNMGESEETEYEKVVKLLKLNSNLLIDTKYFNIEFKYQILSEIDNLDERTNFILINSDNYQAIKLLLNKYKQKIDCIYIDPPYNAKTSEITYKNSYKNSSWLSLMENRISASKSLLKHDFVYYLAIDETEQEVLGQLLNLLLPQHKKVCISIVHNPRGKQAVNISYTHEFTYVIYPDDSKKYISDIERKKVDSRNLRDSGTESKRTDAATCFYPIIVNEKKEIIEIGSIPGDSYHPNSNNIQRKDGLIEIWPIDTKGNERKWRYSKDSVKKILSKLEIKNTKQGLNVIFNKKTQTIRSNWVDPLYDASEYGTKVLQSILGKEQASFFSYPKSLHTVYDLLYAALINNKESIVLDYFAGSGTTGHAVLKLNQNDNGNRKAILVEKGKYFNSVLKQRIQRVIYSNLWKGGKPVEDKGSSKQIVKYFDLEQYEDSLNNIINGNNQNNSDINKEDNCIKYLIDFEGNINSINLNLNYLNYPFDYKMRIYLNDEIRIHPVDLIETFNYLVGIFVNNIQKFKNGLLDYLVIEGLRNEKNVLIIWRTINETFNLIQDNEFIKNEIIKKEYCEIFINGNFLLKNALSIDQLFKETMIG